MGRACAGRQRTDDAGERAKRPPGPASAEVAPLGGQRWDSTNFSKYTYEVDTKTAGGPPRPPAGPDLTRGRVYRVTSYICQTIIRYLE